MVSQASALNAIVVALQHHRRQLENNLVGDQLAGLIAERFRGTVQRRSVVIGELEKTPERFTLAAEVTAVEVKEPTPADTPVVPSKMSLASRSWSAPPMTPPVCSRPSSVSSSGAYVWNPDPAALEVPP